MKVVIAGGSGTLGRRVATNFRQRGFEVVVLTRSPRDGAEHRQVRWDGRTVGPWAAELEGAMIVNLAGELVDRQPTPTNIELLKRSRVEPTQALVKAAAGLTSPPPLWLQMSTLAIYGDGGERTIDERSPVATEPPQMAGVARAWEAAVDGAASERLVVLRTGIVLDNNTRALTRLTRLVRLGLGGRIHTGVQWTSWIHIVDFLRALQFITESPALVEMLHVTAPNPIRNRDMMATLRSALRRPWSPPTPKPFVHLGAWLMRSDPALALTGRRCGPRRLLDHGFEFEYESFDEAVRHLLGGAKP